MKSPLSYSGGKSRLEKTIIEMLPEHVCYVEPFCGAAWVLFNKEPSKAEVINDLDNDLVCFWRVIQHHLEPFLDCFKHAIVSRQVFDWENIKRPETLTDIQRAVRYYYLQRLSFGGKAAGRTFGTSATSGPKLHITDIEERLMEVHWRLAQVTIEHLDACRCIEMYDRPTTLFYVDPPYHGTTQSYANRFEEPDFLRLRDTLMAISGKFVLSLNDDKAIRTIFRQFNIKSVALRYSQGNSRTSSTTRSAERKEVIISNF